MSIIILTKNGREIPYKIPLDDIISGKRIPPKRWGHKVIKSRLIDEGYAYEECSNCGYNEKNLDTEKVCLSLDFIDGDTKNYKLDNLRMLCPNCYLSFNGRFSNSKTFCK